MVYRLKLPRLGETMEEGTIVEWHKKEGDMIKKGDVLYSLETDKTTMDVESIFEGQLKEICCAAGTTIPVGAIVAVVA